MISIEHLPDNLTAHDASRTSTSNIQAAHDVLDARAIRTALERNGCNRLAAAKELHMHKTTLFRRMRKLGIVLPKQDGRSCRKRVQ
jgi:transcriptional regulator with PAS, ATPase and Fis domain